MGDDLYCIVQLEWEGVQGVSRVWKEQGRPHFFAIEIWVLKCLKLSCYLKFSQPLISRIFRFLKIAELKFPEKKKGAKIYLPRETAH